MPRPTHRLVAALLATALATAPCPAARAHDSPEHSIEELSEHIARDGESVALLLRRASQYRVLGQNERAVADLNRVLLLEPNQPGALVELARIYLALGKPDTSLQFIQTALDTSRQPKNGKAHLFATRGDVRAARRDYALAVADYNRAIAFDAGQIDWYLNRAWMLEQMRRTDERIKGLAAGYAATQSVVLQTEWIEALIDGGQAQSALMAIEPRLQQARLRSAWLIRRARARLALPGTPEQSTATRRDLEAAIAEINTRLRPNRPDTALLLDRALAYALSGDMKAARDDIDLAEIYDVNPRQLARLERLLQEQEQTQKLRR
jgi:tetratricopeptide (TPR) repeat protein